VSGSGSGLTALNADNISSGTLDNARLPSTINVTNLVGGGSGLTALNADNISSGTLDNARLPSTINVTNLVGGGSGLTALNADNISSGTLDNARLPSTINVTNLVGDGSGLTALNAGNLASGTVPSARLNLVASDIPSLDASKITSGTLGRPISTSTGVFTSTGNAVLVGPSGGGQVGLTINDGDGNTNITFNHASRIPDQNGSSGRIDCGVDGTSGYMRLRVKDNVTGGTSTGNLPECVRIQEGYVRAYSDFYVDSNVGIGTTSPGAKLHIGPKDDDHIYLASSNNDYGWKIDTDDQGSGEVPFRIRKRLNGTDTTVLTIKNQNGNVGIGTADPTEALSIYRNDANPTYAKIVSSASDRAGIILSESYPDDNVIIEYDGTGSGAGNYLAFYSGVSTWAAKGTGLNFVPSNGRVGIGVTNPDAILDVRSSTEIPRLRGDAGRSLFMGSNYTHVNSTGFSETNGAYAWDGYPGVVRMNSGGEYRVHGQTGTYTVRVRADGGFATFTGSHDTFTPFSEDDVGKIVYSTGNYATEVKDENVNGVIYDYLTIMDSCPVVKICATENDKRVMGVLSTRQERTQIEEITKEEYELITGDERYAYEKKEDSGVYIRDIDTGEFSRGYYNAVGEGGIWVCNKNGNFENGDYITSSTVAGYGQKQNDDLLHNYTVAKITTDCDFSEIWLTTKKHKKTREGYLFDENNEPVYENILDTEGNTRKHLKFKLRYLLPDGTQISEEEYTTKTLADEKVYIAAFVGCTYHCG
jgi:hypothetical protein